MRDKPRSSQGESQDKDAASVPGEESPKDRFRRLAQSVFRVPYQKIKVAEEAEKASMAKKRNPRDGS